MRELKFRAWDNANNEWLNKEDVECLTIYLDGRYEIDRGWCIVTPDLTIEQYTGDKDQYNRPIYEGDIIQICETDIGEVLQDYDGRWIILGVPKEKLRDGDSVLLGGLEKLQKWCLADTLGKEYCSVIGNIHENKELLNGHREN